MKALLYKTAFVSLLLLNATAGFSQPGFPPPVTPTIPLDGGIISFLLVGGLLGAGLIRKGRKN
jgi:hypothetical protein